MRRLISAIAIVTMAATTVLAQSQTHERFNDLRQRIDSAKELPAEHKERLHAAVNTAESSTAIIEEATENILELTAGGSAADATRRAEVEAEVRAELARIGGSHQTLGALRHELEAETTKGLTPEQKREIDAALRELRSGRISKDEALAAIACLRGYETCTTPEAAAVGVPAGPVAWSTIRVDLALAFLVEIEAGGVPMRTVGGKARLLLDEVEGRVPDQ